MSKNEISNWLLEKHKCEFCGKIMTEYYGSGRFCSRKCSCSYVGSLDKENRYKKVSLKLKGRKRSKEYAERRAKMMGERRLKKFVVIGDDILDITYGELEEYRKNHTVCDICGKPETCTTSNDKTNKTPNKLCIEHDHKTKKFRGLVCNKCNNRLAWLDENLDSIIKYIKSDT